MDLTDVARADAARVRLAGPDDVDGVMTALVRLVADGVPPEDVDWDDGLPRQGGLFTLPQAVPLVAAEPPAPVGGTIATPSAGPAPAAAPSRRPRRPDGFVRLARDAALNDDPQRHLLIHRLAADLHRDPQAWADTLRPDRLQLEKLAREVRHEIHRMHAFVRFRPVVDETGRARSVAWYEPAHPVVRAAAPFFQRRFASLHWAILTPRGSVSWDRRALTFGPPAQRADAPAADAGEALWLAYYRSIFNPARANGDLMRRHMPTRYWANLPEMAVAAPLLDDAAQRTGQMLAHAADTTRKLPRPMRRADAQEHDAAGHPIDHVSATSAVVQGLPVAADKEEARQQLKRLAARIDRCDRCPAAHDATQAVCGRGNARASLMLVGEQPGDQEDLAGRPFVGPAGQLLQRAIAALGWPLDALFVTNAVKHFHYTVRGPRRIHKTPEQAAIAACLDWLEAEVATVDPPALLALGQTAARALLGDDVGPTPPGSVHARADGRVVRVVWHPSALLRAGVGQGGAPVDAHPQWQAWLDQLAPAGAVFEVDRDEAARVVRFADRATGTAEVDAMPTQPTLDA